MPSEMWWEWWTWWGFETREKDMRTCFDRSDNPTRSHHSHHRHGVRLKRIVCVLVSGVTRVFRNRVASRRV